MHQHPAVLETLMKDRMADLRHSAQLTEHMRRERRWRRFTAATRRGTGWLLVDMGLRLAVPRAATHHRAAGGK